MLRTLLSAAGGFLAKPWFQYFTYGLAFAAAAMFLALRGEVTNDSWWHLNTGKELWEGTFSFYDPHNWTAPGAFWPAHELGFEWLLYGLWLLGGESFILMALLNVALVIGALVLLVPFKKLRNKFGAYSNALVPLMLFLAAYTMLGSVQIRAQGISYFLFALTIRLVLAKRPFWIPVVMVAWVWLHGSVLIGIALMGIATLIFIGRWLLDRGSKEKFKDARNYSIAGILSLAATCTSPLGFGIWTYFVSTFSYGDTQISEWAPLYSDPTLMAYTLTGLILLIISFWLLRGKNSSWELIYLYAMSILFFLYSLTALRVYTNFVLVALPVILLALMTVIKPMPKAQEDKNEKLRNRAAIGAASLISIVALAFTYNVSVQVMDNGTRDPFIPNGVADALRSDHCMDATWNDYDTGSYLLWYMPDVKVSIDSRFDLYPQWVREASGAVVPPGDSADPTDKLNVVFEDYGINCMVMSKTTDSDALEERGLKVLAENRDMIVFDIPSSGIPERKDN